MSNVFADENCKIKTKSLLIKAGSFDSRVLEHQGCNDTTINRLITFLNNVNGVTSRFQIEEKFKDLTIEPKIIRIVDLANLIKNKAELPFNYKVKDLKIVGENSNYLSLDNTDLSIECTPDCKKIGSNNFKVFYKENNNKKYIWVSGKTVKSQSVFVLNRTVDIHSTILNRGAVEEKTVDINSIDSYFTEVDKIHFYKPNKRINKGDPLKSSDLTPVRLVNIGRKVKVIIKSGKLEVKTSAISRQSGVFNNFIELYNPASSKKYLGKVIDYNTVVVEL